MKILLEVNSNKASVLLEILRNISFVKEVKEISDNEITDAAMLKSIEGYENGRIKPTACNLEDLKALIHA